MNNDELLQAIDRIRVTMIEVATGGRPINDVNDAYRALYARVAAALGRKGISNTLPYGDLWEWYGRWKSGDMPTYQSRREFVNRFIEPLLNTIRTGHAEPFMPTGWQRVDRAVGELRDRLAAASTEEQFQAVGLLGREVLISVAQAVFVSERHPTEDGVPPSETDANRMLGAYFSAELQGGSNEEARNHARSALKLAVALQHRRTANFRDAAMCVEGTTAVVNLVAILSGKRDPAS